MAFEGCEGEFFYTIDVPEYLQLVPIFSSNHASDLSIWAFDNLLSSCEPLSLKIALVVSVIAAFAFIYRGYLKDIMIFLYFMFVHIVYIHKVYIAIKNVKYKIYRKSESHVHVRPHNRSYGYVQTCEHGEMLFQDVTVFQRQWWLQVKLVLNFGYGTSK